MTYIPGLCSVSFRASSVDEIIHLASTNGLIGIEWGSDVHVPVGQRELARSVGERTRAAGLDPSSYGTYLWAGEANSRNHLAAIVDTAVALGAGNIRVWAGPRGRASADVSPEQFDAAALQLWAISEMASRQNMTVSLEFHANTLVDNGPAAARLLAAAEHPALFTYWQPTPGIALSDSLAQLALLRQDLSYVHVFNRDANRARALVEEAAAFWTDIMGAVRPSPRWTTPKYAMIEFVKDDDFANLQRDSAFLKSILPQTERA